MKPINQNTEHLISAIDILTILQKEGLITKHISDILTSVDDLFIDDLLIDSVSGITPFFEKLCGNFTISLVDDFCLDLNAKQFTMIRKVVTVYQICYKNQILTEECIS